jgi:hypothetical protein
VVVTALVDARADDERADRDRREEHDGGGPARETTPVHGSPHGGDGAQLVGEPPGLRCRGLLPARASVGVEDGS